MERNEKQFFTELIEAVRGEPILYIKSSPGYMNKAEKRKAWERISSQVNKPEDECERRWALLREKYTRELRKQDTPSGSGASTWEVWEYFHSMGFLKPHIKSRKTRSNSSHALGSGLEKVDTLLESSMSEPFSPPSAKRQKTAQDGFVEVRNEFKKTIEQLRDRFCEKKEDEDMIFMKSIVSLMKCLPEKDKNDLRKLFIEKVVEKRNQHFADHQL